MMINKLKENKGITIIHALIGVLVLTIFGGLIYESAMSNLNSFEKEKRYQQTCLAVSSAAKIFVDGFDGDYVEFTVVNNGELVSASGWRYNDVNLSNPIANSEFIGFYEEMYENRDDEYAMVTKNYTITASNGSITFDPVTVHCIFSQYRVFANFYLAGGNIDGNNSYMCCEIPIIIEEGETITEKDFASKTNKIYYDMEHATIYKGSYDD